MANEDKKMMVLRAVGPYETEDLDKIAESIQGVVDKIYEPGEITVLVLSGVATMDKKELKQWLTEMLIQVG